MGNLAKGFPAIFGVFRTDESIITEFAGIISEAGKLNIKRWLKAIPEEERPKIELCYSLSKFLESEKFCTIGDGRNKHMLTGIPYPRGLNYIIEKIKAKFGESAPSEFEQNYGFDQLLQSVSRQVDFNGTVVRVIPEKEIWLWRYVDYLEEAEKYIAWRKHDNKQADKLFKSINKKSK